MTVDIRSAEVLRSQILVVPNDNYRTDVDEDVAKVEEMALLLRTSGQLEEVGLMPLPAPGPGGEIYRLTYGFRRLAAWDRLNWGDKKPVRAAIKDYSAADIKNGKAILDNYDANHHVPVHPYDQGRLIVMLEEGAKGPNANGEEIITRTPMTPEQVQNRMRLTDSQYRKLKALDKGTDLAVREEARRAQAPMRLLYKIASTKGEGETVEERMRSRQLRQEEVLNTWVAKRQSLKAENRQRARSVKSDDEDISGAVDHNLDMVEMDETDADTSEEAAPRNGKTNGAGGERAARTAAPVLSEKRQLDAKGRTAGFYQAALEVKIAALAKAKTAEEKEARARAEGAAEVMGFFLGQTKSFPKGLLKEEDFKALQKKIDEVAAQAKEEAN